MGSWHTETVGPPHGSVYVFLRGAGRQQQDWFYVFIFNRRFYIFFFTGPTSIIRMPVLISAWANSCLHHLWVLCTLWHRVRWPEKTELLKEGGQMSTVWVMSAQNDSKKQHLLEPRGQHRTPCQRAPSTAPADSFSLLMASSGAPFAITSVEWWHGLHKSKVATCEARGETPLSPRCGVVTDCFLRASLSTCLIPVDSEIHDFFLLIPVLYSLPYDIEQEEALSLLKILYYSARAHTYTSVIYLLIYLANIHIEKKDS